MGCLDGPITVCEGVVVFGVNTSEMGVGGVGVDARGFVPMRVSWLVVWTGVKSRICRCKYIQRDWRNLAHILEKDEEFSF